MPFTFDGIGEFGVSVKQAQSKVVHYTGNVITKAKLNAKEVKATSNDSFRYYLNTSGDLDTYSEDKWEEVMLNTEHIFINTGGTVIRWRVIATGYGGSNTYLEWIKIAVTEQE